jgi:universal stress protein E
MEQINKILVVVDPTAKEHPVVARAAWLAERTGAAVELFICEYDQYLAGERFFDSASLEKARTGLMQRNLQRLRKLGQAMADRGVEVSVDAVWYQPLHEGIVRKVESTHPDVVLKDTHYHQLIRRSLFSNTDWNLIRDCPVPLMLVKATSGNSINTVIAAVDPVHERDEQAQLDRKIIETSQWLCAKVGADLHVVHAFDPAPAYAVSADAMSFPIAEPMNELMEGLRRKHTHAMHELLAHYSIPESHVHIAEGDTRDVLSTLAEQLHADLLVMGAVSRGAIEHLLLGSTAERVLDHIPCDLLIIKPGT